MSSIQNQPHLETCQRTPLRLSQLDSAFSKMCDFLNPYQKRQRRVQGPNGYPTISVVEAKPDPIDGVRASFYGIDISQVFPSQLLRTWHLQLAILWIATAFLAGGLFIAPSLGGRDPAYQSFGVNLLFVALIVVVTGSLLGEWLGIRQMLGRLWEWFGDQGWEYLDLGKAWQIGLAAGLVIWVVLVFRAVRPSFSDPERGELSVLFFLSGLAISVFYLPAFFYSGSTNFAIVDHWRFWIIHLWVEDFFELFVTVVVAVLFFRLGAVTVVTAKRVIYLDAILYLMGGILGTAHHWYFTGQ